MKNRGIRKNNDYLTDKEKIHVKERIKRLKENIKSIKLQRYHSNEDRRNLILYKNMINEDVEKLKK